MVEVPLNRGTQTGVEVEARCPAELGGDAVGVDGIPQIVPRTIGDELDEIPPAAALWTRPELADQVADGVHDLEIASLVAAAHVVGAPRRA